VTPLPRLRALALVCCLSLLASSAAAAELGVKIHRIVHQDPVLEVVVAVEDDRGQPITDLRLADFAVRIAEVESEVLDARSFVDSGMPFGTLLLIDTSGSMRGSMHEVREAARRYVAGMKGGDVAIVAQFNDTVTGLDQPWSNDVAVLEEQIAALEAAGSETHLYEALNRGINMIASGADSPALRNILVLSDGKDEGSPQQWTYDRARSVAGHKDVPISAVGYVVDPTDDHTASLAQLSLDTRGRYSPAASVDQIEARFRGVQHAIHSLWVVSVRTGPMEAGDRQLLVEVSHGDGEERTSTSNAMRLSLDGPWTGAEEVVPAPPWWRKSIVLAIVAGIVALVLLLVIILVALARGRSRRVLEARIDSANRATEEARRSADAQIAEAKRQAEEARAMAAEAQATAEEAIESATASVPVADPEPAPAPPRRTVFHEPGRAATGYALLLADGSRIALGDLQSGAVGLGKDPTRAQVVVDHPTVSGLHARLSLQASELVVEDAGSSNGTYVDGQDIRGRGPVVVAAGQQLQLGLLKTVVEAS
jgi:hypothetical protein